MLKVGIQKILVKTSKIVEGKFGVPLPEQVDSHTGDSESNELVPEFGRWRG